MIQLCQPQIVNSNSLTHWLMVTNPLLHIAEEAYFKDTFIKAIGTETAVHCYPSTCLLVRFGCNKVNLLTAERTPLLFLLESAVHNCTYITYPT